MLNTLSIAAVVPPNQWLVRAPDGKLAVFSAVVEDFTATRLDEWVAHEILCRSMSMEDASEVITKALIDTELSRFAKAMKRIEAAHGKRRTDYLRETIGAAK